ncbi:hypothetical protein D3C71_1749070 [compost metagenome]
MDWAPSFLLIREQPVESMAVTVATAASRSTVCSFMPESSSCLPRSLPRGLWTCSTCTICIRAWPHFITSYCPLFKRIGSA